jgi:hypothetical protein
MDDKIWKEFCAYYKKKWNITPERSAIETFLEWYHTYLKTQGKKAEGI